MRVTVEEQGQKKALNTPGGDALFARFGGPDGLPFFAFLDGNGDVIVNSKRPAKDAKDVKGGNIGHPFQPHEIDWFMVMLSKAAPRMTEDERATIEKWLRTQKKQREQARSPVGPVVAE